MTWALVVGAWLVGVPIALAVFAAVGPVALKSRRQSRELAVLLPDASPRPADRRPTRCPGDGTSAAAAGRSPRSRSTHVG